MAAESRSQAFHWWVCALAAVGVPVRLSFVARLPRQRAINWVSGFAGVVRAGWRAVGTLSPGCGLFRKLLFLRTSLQEKMKPNYMFKPTPELSLRLLWLCGRRGLTWR